MKKVYFFIFIFSLLLAKENPKKFYEDLAPDDKKEGWDIGFDNISLNFSSTSINNQENYQNFSNTNFQGNSQILAEGKLFFHSNFYAQKFVIFNLIFAEYGRNIIKPKNAPKIDNTTLDRIFISTDYTQKIWNFDTLGGFDMGPFIQLSYQTQFMSPPTRDRTKILNLNPGLKLFDGKYLKSLNFSIFGEENFTYSSPTQSIGFNLFMQAQYPFNEHVKWLSTLNFKQYFFNNYPRNFSPQSEFEFHNKIETSLIRHLFIAPYISFYLLKGQYFKTPATNLIIGISLSYKQTYTKAKVKTNDSP